MKNGVTDARVKRCAHLFELRAALDDYDLRGAPPRAALATEAGRVPADSPLPELARRAVPDQAQGLSCF